MNKNYLKTKKFSLVILAITSILCSRGIFFFFDDPEGPNLLIVLGFASLLYLISLTVLFQKFFSLNFNNIKKLLIIILIQIVIVYILYLFLK